MKIYEAPKDVKPPMGFEAFGSAEYEDIVKDQKRFEEELRQWFLNNGYTGKYSGETVSFPKADGYAVYMLFCGSKSGLVHLPHGDAYHEPMVEYMPKREVVKRIESEKAMRKLFGQ